MKTKLAFALVAAVALASASGRASDHIDGVGTTIDNAADITDVFAFTSPTDATRLVLIMNVHTLAFKRSRFSNAVDYKFRIRPIANQATLAPSTDPAKEQSITCTFSGGLVLIDPKQKVTCTHSFAGGSEKVTFDTRGEHEAGGSGQSANMRAFAGVRSDPWFLDLAKTLKFGNNLRVLDVPGVNGLAGQNVLSIVVEIEKSRLPGTLLAVTGQTVRR